MNNNTILTFCASLVAKHCLGFLWGKEKYYHRIPVFHPYIFFKEKPVLKEAKSFLTKTKHTSKHPNPERSVGNPKLAQYGLKENMCRHAVKMGCKCLIKTSLVSK